MWNVGRTAGRVRPHHTLRLRRPPPPPWQTQATMAQAEAGRRFDLGLLRSPGERISLELPCTLLSQGALVREPGRLLVTDQRLYFQPLHTIGGGAAVHSHALAAVAAAARRRSSLRDLALEVGPGFVATGGGGAAGSTGAGASKRVCSTCVHGTSEHCCRRSLPSICFSDSFLPHPRLCFSRNVNRSSSPSLQRSRRTLRLRPRGAAPARCLPLPAERSGSGLWRR